MNADLMVQISGVTKRYGKVMALRGIDLQLARGRCLGIFGPNGAGKTTLLRVLSTLARPSSGMMMVAGFDVLRQAEKVRPLLGVLSHRTFLYQHLTGFENLHFYGRMFGVKSLPDRIDTVLGSVGLKQHAQQLVGAYSRGMQQRLAIARAILHHPQLLLFDEPFTSLDQQAVSHVQSLLKQLLAAESTIIVSTHDLQRGLELCDEIVIQLQGRIVHRCATLDLDTRSFERLYANHVG